MLKYVQIYFDFLNSIEPLDDAERGRLFTAILRYASTGELPNLEGNERFIFPTAKAMIDRDQEQYKKTCAARAEYGQRGGLAKASKSKQKVAKRSKSIQEKEEEKEEEKEKDKYIKATPFEIALDEFRQYRKEKRNPLGEIAEKKLLKELDRLSGGNEETKIQILDQSIRNGWAGVFELRNRKASGGYEQHKVTDAELSHLLVNLDD